MGSDRAHRTVQLKHMPLDPGTAALLELIANSGYPPMYEGTPEAARKGLRGDDV